MFRHRRGIVINVSVRQCLNICSQYPVNSRNHPICSMCQIQQTGISGKFPTSAANIGKWPNQDVNNIASRVPKPFLITKMESVKTGRTTGKIILDLSDPTRSARRSKNPLNPCNPYCMIHCKPNDGFVDFLQLRVAFWRPLMSRNIF